jgi:hypothetical protein
MLRGQGGELCGKVAVSSQRQLIGMQSVSVKLWPIPIKFDAMDGNQGTHIIGVCSFPDSSGWCWLL